MAAATHFLGCGGRCSLRQRDSALLLACVPARNARRRLAAPARAGLFDGLFGKPADKPAKPGKPGKPGMKPISGSCKTCQNKGGVTCSGCKGSGKNKSNGNPFERYKCYDCQARARVLALPRPISLPCSDAACVLTVGSPRRASASCRARLAAAAAAVSRPSRRASDDAGVAQAKTRSQVTFGAASQRLAPPLALERFRKWNKGTSPAHAHAAVDCLPRLFHPA